MLPDRVLPQLVIILFFSFRVPTTSSFVQPQDDEEGGEKVEAWDSKITYILATVGYAVGLGKYYYFFLRKYLFFHFLYLLNF